MTNAPGRLYRTLPINTFSYCPFLLLISGGGEYKFFASSLAIHVHLADDEIQRSVQVSVEYHYEFDVIVPSGTNFLLYFVLASYIPVLCSSDLILLSAVFES